MDVQIDDRWSSFVQDAVKNGRYRSAAELVGDALHLMQERDAKYQSLKRAIQEGLDESGDLEGAQLDAYFDNLEQELAAEGR